MNKRLQIGGIIFDEVDQFYYYDEGEYLKALVWPSKERERAPMHQICDATIRLDDIPLPHYQRDYEAGSPMHQRCSVESWQRIIEV